MSRPASQLAARLLELPHDALAELAARLCVEGGTAAQRQADELLAAHKPLPQWAVQGVLLSSDLVPHVLAPLQLEDGAAAAVCSAWAEGWRATSEGRRRLRQVPIDVPRELLVAIARGGLEMVAISGGEQERLVAYTRGQLHILDASMQVSHSFTSSATSFTANEESIFVTGGAPMRRLSHDGTEVVAAVPEDESKSFFTPVLAPGGLLFCVYGSEDEDEDLYNDEIHALDAATLELRYRFGQALQVRTDAAAGSDSRILFYASAMVVVGDELFVCDGNNDRLQVFSLAGEHRRSISGEWEQPRHLCVVKDRLYLIGAQQHACVKSIFVLSLEGALLQVYTHPEGQSFKSLCAFRGNLLAVHENRESWIEGVIALQGL